MQYDNKITLYLSLPYQSIDIRDDFRFYKSLDRFVMMIMQIN